LWWAQQWRCHLFYTDSFPVFSSLAFIDSIYPPFKVFKNLICSLGSYIDALKVLANTEKIWNLVLLTDEGTDMA